MQRREGIRRNLGTCTGQRGEQRGLACVRESHDADVGNELELEAQPPLLASFAELMHARRLPRRRLESRVAASPAAATRDNNVRALAVQVRHTRSALGNHGPGRNMQDDGLALGAGASSTLAGAAVGGDEAALVAKGGECCIGRVGDDHDVTGLASVAPVRTARRNVFLSPEARCSTTA